MPCRENSRGGSRWPLRGRRAPGESASDRNYLELGSDRLHQAFDAGERGRQGARAAAARPLVVHLEQVVLQLDDVEIAAVALEVRPHALVDEVGDERELVPLLVVQRFVVERRMPAAERGVGMRLC